MTRQIPWLRVFVEGVVIVASILLAFGIQAWWDGVQERAEEGRIERMGLESMHADLVADTSEIRSVIYYAQLHDRAAASVVHLLQAPPSPDSVGMLLREFIRGAGHNFQRSAFISLRSSDRLSLITNESLRATIIEYFDEGQPELDGGQTLELERRERLLAAMAPHVRWPKPESPETSRPFEDGPVVVTGSWEAFRSDNTFVWSVQDLGGLSRDVRVGGERLLRENAELRAMIEAELEGLNR